MRNRERRRSLRHSSFCAGRSSFMGNALWQIRGSVECGQHFAGLKPVAWDIETQEEKLQLLLSRQAVGLRKRVVLHRFRSSRKLCIFALSNKKSQPDQSAFSINKLTTSILILSQHLKETLLDLSYLVSACRNSSSHPRENDAARS